MIKRLLQLAVVSFMALSAAALASIDVFEFSSEQKRAEYNALTKELRCPKCQNQDIADSNSPIAQDMRFQVHRLIEEGKSPATVVEFMVERFGDFVTYKPKIIPATYLLWFGPFMLVGLGLLVVLLLSSKRRKSNEPQLVELDASAKERLASMLNDADSTKKSNSDKGKE